MAVYYFVDLTSRFEGIIDLARRLNDPRMNTPAETREKAAAVLHSLFPVWFTAAVNVRPFCCHIMTRTSVSVAVVYLAAFPSDLCQN